MSEPVFDTIELIRLEMARLNIVTLGMAGKLEAIEELARYHFNYGEGAEKKLAKDILRHLDALSWRDE